MDMNIPPCELFSQIRGVVEYDPATGVRSDGSDTIYRRVEEHRMMFDRLALERPQSQEFGGQSGRCE